MKITIVYDNKKVIQTLKTDWGFSAVIETEGHNILFDAGGNGKILMGNLSRLNINPLIIDTIFISHHHFDHVGGLSAFLNQQNNVRLFSPNSFRGVKNVRENVYITDSRELYPNIYTTGELDGIEQSLLIQTAKGMVIVVGCSHPGLDQIIKVAEQYGTLHAIIGGFHDFRRFQYLEKADILCPAHCTRYMEEIKMQYPEKYLEAGAGRVVHL
ncbi:MAG: MBL fold metallo-hydrolase [Candidatus Marinimicrobia bacterium]|nr:MBL fold metallo-hydrolase [Candidatus Neomarinimicrobiota bacterium]